MPVFNPFDTTQWVETALERLRQLSVEQASPEAIPEDHLRPFLARLASLASLGTVRVLDLGGGLGDNWLQLMTALPPESKDRVEYWIADTPNNVSLGRRLHAASSPRPAFTAILDMLEKDGLSFDLVLCCGTLQYIDDWRSVLAVLSRLCAGEAFFTRTLFNRRAETFRTVQVVCPGVGPHAGTNLGHIVLRVFNPEEVRTTAQALGLKTTLFCREADYSQQFQLLPEPSRYVEYATLILQQARAQQ